MSPEEALENAIKIAGSMQSLADYLGVTKGAVSQWKLEGRQVPAKHCQPIERLTNGTSRCKDLRPDVFGAPAESAGARRADDPAPGPEPSAAEDPPSRKNLLECGTAQPPLPDISKPPARKP